MKLINDFLNVRFALHRIYPPPSQSEQFFSVRMRECDVWKNVSDAEFDNAMEGMEKLVMNRLYEL